MAGSKKPSSSKPAKGKGGKGELSTEQLGKATGGAPGIRPPTGRAGG